MGNQLIYKDHARYYDLIYEGMQKNYEEDVTKIEDLIRRYKKSKGNTLLDVACGSGKHLRYFVKKLQRLFKVRSEAIDTIDAYLASSPIEKSHQGGANGKGIYTEIPLGGYDLAYETLVHEYLHRVITPRNYFMNTKDKVLRKLYGMQIKSLYPDPVGILADEVVIHAVANIYLFKEDPQRRIARVKKQIKDGRSRTPSDLHLWNLVKLSAPCLKDYLEDRSEHKETQAELGAIFQEYVDQEVTKQPNKKS